MLGNINQKNCVFPTGNFRILLSVKADDTCLMNTAHVSRDVLRVARLRLMEVAERNQRCEMDCAKCIML